MEHPARIVGHNPDMALTIPVAHDFICPWCWVGLIQIKRLQKEFHVKFDWRGYELFPDELEWPDYPVDKYVPHNKPSTPTRFELLLAAEGIVLPSTERPHKMRTHNAHEAVEYAKTEGVADELVEALYRAYWEEGLEINEPKVIKKIAKSIVDDVDALMKAIDKKKFKHKIVGFDDDAHRDGVYNVPTFFIGGQRYAEQPYKVLQHALEAAQEEGAWTNIYSELHFPSIHEDRPYTFINMVTTIDGKILSGSRGDDVADLGSKVDHKLMKRIEGSADAIIAGAQTIRATPANWNPRVKKRIVVSQSGNLPTDSAYLTDGDAYVATTGSSTFKVPNGTKILRAGNQELDFELLLSRIKGLGVKNLLVTGGSELNAELLRRDLVDELFLTIAPKVKLGKDVPTYAGGEALPRDSMQKFKLVEHHVVGDEIFLRYRRERKK